MDEQGFTVDQEKTKSKGDLNDLITKDVFESSVQFEIRRQLTMRILQLKNPKINPNTALTLGHMIINKADLGLSYDSATESAIEQVLGYLEKS